MGGEKSTSAYLPCRHAAWGIINACRITPPWTVMLSELSLCNSPAGHSQVHWISNARVTWGALCINAWWKYEAWRWQGVEYSNIKGGKTFQRLLLLQHHIKQIRGDVKVRREVGKSVFTCCIRTIWKQGLSFPKFYSVVKCQKLCAKC